MAVPLERPGVPRHRNCSAVDQAVPENDYRGDIFLQASRKACHCGVVYLGKEPAFSRAEEVEGPCLGALSKDRNPYLLESLCWRWNTGKQGGNRVSYADCGTKWKEACLEVH